MSSPCPSQILPEKFYDNRPHKWQTVLGTCMGAEKRTEFIHYVLWAQFMRCLTKSPLCIVHHLGGIFPELPRIHLFIIIFDSQSSLLYSKCTPKRSLKSLCLILLWVLALFFNCSVSLGNLLDISKPVSLKMGYCEVEGSNVIKLSTVFLSVGLSGKDKLRL